MYSVINIIKKSVKYAYVIFFTNATMLRRNIIRCIDICKKIIVFYNHTEKIGRTLQTKIKIERGTERFFCI